MTAAAPVTALPEMRWQAQAPAMYGRSRRTARLAGGDG